MKLFIENLEKQIKNENIVMSLKFLLKRYKNEIEKLKEDESFRDDKKVQTVSVLSEVVQDFESILEIK